MRKTTTAVLVSAACLMSAGVAMAQTPQGGATLAGGNNGADAKADATMKAGEMHSPSGSPSAPVAHGQSTEHPDGKMRANKNF